MGWFDDTMGYDNTDLGVDPTVMDGATDGDPVAGDVSMGAPDESPTTPQGTGTGYYIDGSQQYTMFGAIDKALNYALQKDQTKFALEHGVTVGGTPVAVPKTAAAQAAQNKQMLLMAAIGLGAILLLKD